MDVFMDKYKFPIAMGVVGLVLLVGGVVSSGIVPKTFVGSNTPGIKSTQVPAASLTSSASKVAIDVSGAVQNPGVYYLSGSSRIEEAIQSAGGVTTEADPAYLSKNINLAQKLTDGMKIYIPAKEEGGASKVLGSSEVNGSKIINLNSSSSEELDSLPGIGTVTAQKIISSRPYGSIEELLIKKAVSRSVYDKIKEQVGI